jgi:arylsulfatase A-like enzyme
MSRPRAAAALAVPLAVALAAGLAAGCTRRAEPERPPDIVLVSVDTLRADRLGCYGNPRPVSPAIDRFRGDAVRFETVLAHASSTLSSHAAMLTSLPPTAHGASFALRRRLPDAAVTLAEVLRDAGYRTVGITASGQLAPVFGLGQGFELYRSRVEKHEPGAFWPRVGAGLSQLADPDPRPVFLFLHTYETHHPYTPEPALLDELDPGYRGGLGHRVPVELLERANAGEIVLDAADRRRVERAYEAEIRSVDRAFGRLIEGLAASGRLDRAVVVLTSDHGEEFGEHGRIGWHSHTLYEELLRVPLLVRLPSREAAGASIAAPVRLIDLAPTLLELAGVAAPPQFAGRSLLPLVRGDSPRELPAVASLDEVEGASHAVRWQGWKLYDGRLFDLARDPGETVDLAGDETARRAELERLLAAVLADRAEGGPTAELDAAAERELRALGYL